MGLSVVIESSAGSVFEMGLTRKNSYINELSNWL